MTIYNHPYYRSFNDQRQNARKRNVEWQFEFDSWLEWWGEDITNRGRKQGQLVMARNGDTGPYHPDNVRKALCSENVSESRLGKVSNRKGAKHTIESRLKNSEAQKAIHAKRKLKKETEICM
jgi:hypothetical protein